jgi:ABC-type Na+ efflux pump permease subunit
LWRDSGFVAWRDIRHLLRLPQVWVWMFVMPLVLSFIVGSIMQSMAGRIERLAVYAPPDRGFLADDLVRRLRASGYQVLMAADLADAKTHSLWLAIPPRFTESVLTGPPAQLALGYPADYALAGWEQYRVERAADELLADLVVLAKRGGTADAGRLAALVAEPRKLGLRVTSAGQARKLILGYQQSVPGFIVMFTLMVSLSAGSVMLIAERRQGVLSRLAATPVSRASIVAGKLVGRLVIGLIQVGVAMLAGRWWFGMDWGGHSLWAVLLLLFAYTVLCSALSLAFSSTARSESQCLAASIIATNLMAAIGGCWWPVEVTPRWMQQAAILLPTGWAMDGLHKLISYGASPVSVVPHLAALAVASLAVGWLAVRRFRCE